MALGLFWARSDSLRVVAGYESGHTMVFEHDLVDAGAAAAVRRVYTSQPHSQPGEFDVQRPKENVWWKAAGGSFWDLIFSKFSPLRSRPARNTISLLLQMLSSPSIRCRWPQTAGGHHHHRPRRRFGPDIRDNRDS